MIDDDASPEELERWYRRTPEEIEAEKAQRWNTAWSALRTPDHLAFEPDTLAGCEGADLVKPHRGPYVAPALQQLDPYQRSLLDATSAHEATGYDVLYSPNGYPRHIPAGPDGQADYRQHPNRAAQIPAGPNKGKWSTAAGRYQIIYPTWKGLQANHSDLTDFSPNNQDKGAWYDGWERYARETGGRDLSQDLRNPDRYPQITAILHKEWTSLPGGAAQGQDQGEFARRLRAGLSRYQPSQP
jgi:muramidase (phage lysozyme)